MALAIRLSRGGRTHRPFYRIVVADKRMPRDGRYIEKLGTYNPLLPQDSAERVQMVEERVKYWLDQGAKPSERVALFLGKAGLIDMPEQPNRPNKSAPGEKAKMREADKEEKRKAADEAAKQAEEDAKAAAEAAANEATNEEEAAKEVGDEEAKGADVEQSENSEPATETPEEAADEEKKD